MFTPEDSLVFGGNFLHGFNIDGQLKVTRLESRLSVPTRYRFPFFQELNWYAAAGYLRRLKSALGGGDGGKRALPSTLTRFELAGLSVMLPQLRVWADSPLFCQ